MIVEFLKDYQRMCRSYKDCIDGCPLYEKECFGALLIAFENNSLNAIAGAVEQWSKEHPIVTNAGKFEEVFGRPPKFQSGDWYCPPIVTEPCCVGLDCNICRKWWEEPYKEQTVVKGGEK